MNNADKKLARFSENGNGQRPAQNENREVSERDGLFEQTQLVNRKLVSRDGRQLLREQTFEGGLI